ncbi:MAG: PQQ-dependent sugar dehydrogenase, partial [Nitrosopumilus sp.]|nr:PQQ-dependent sugar dehydrogenase [Nitrosopumilus sp.]
IGDETKPGLQNPILHTGDDTWAPSGAVFYYGDKIPQWNGKYFVATLRGNHLHMIEFDIENNKVVSDEKIFQGNFGRLRDVATGPDGYLYILTSNQDGRGSPQINDDRILRITPLNAINSFEDCFAAGFPIMESYPRQCRTGDGENFVEDIIIIPQWIQDSAILWSDDVISDETFVDGLQELVNYGVLENANPDSENKIPKWIKNSAKWWATGQIDNQTFVQSIQWMMDKEFLRVQR